MKPTWKHGVGLGLVISAILVVFLLVKQDTFTPVVEESPSIQPEPKLSFLLVVLT
jgi:predicted anti-sigma-YlaC factor YlaD